MSISLIRVVSVNRNQYSSLRTLFCLLQDRRKKKRKEYGAVQFHNTVFVSFQVLVEMGGHVSKTIKRVENNDPLRSVDWSNKGTHGKVTDDDVSRLCHALRHNTQVRTLCLDRTGVTEKSIRDIAELLTVNTTLKTLELCYTETSDEGVQNLFEALMDNASLTNIELSGNRITDDGVQSIAEVLKVNSTLKRIGLEGNCISEKGLGYLAAAMTHNTSIESVGMGSNARVPMDSKIAYQICELCESNKGKQK